MILNQNDEMPEAPVYPEEWACCDSGCGENCVYEIYRREKAQYDAWQKQLKPKENFTSEQMAK